MDNAAGSQVVKGCINSINTYLSKYNVSPSAEYKVSQIAISGHLDGYNAAARYINASSDEIAFGPSTTQLVRNISIALRFNPGDEIVLSKLDHEAHLAAWVQVARWKNLKIRWWIPTKNTKTNPKLEAEDLKAQDLINKNTRIVCFTNTSNILGSITDVTSITKTVKAINPKTLVSVDAVAYAPHCPIDVKAFGVDFYFFSWYKVYGPHMSQAYINKAVFEQLDSLGHFFLPTDCATNFVGLCGGSFELIQSLTPVVEYLESLDWNWVAKQENDLQKVLLDFIATRPEIQLYGEPKADRDLRVSVVSFRVLGCSSAAIVRKIYDNSKCTPTSGHFWARRLIHEVLDIQDAEDGVVRCSFLHYNTVEEVEELVLTLDRILNEMKPSNSKL